MKTSVSFLVVFASAAALVVLLHAQGIATSSASPDSVVQLTAESNGLTQVSPDGVPTDGGAFWIVTADGMSAPYPFLPVAYRNVPIYAISDGVFLVDASGGQVDVQGLGV